MKKNFYLFGILILSGMMFLACVNSKKTNDSAEAEESAEIQSETTPVEEEWLTLFNGEDFTGWRVIIAKICLLHGPLKMLLLRSMDPNG